MSRFRLVGALALGAMLVLAPFATCAAEFVLRGDKGVYPEEDRAIRELVARFEQKTGKTVELIQPVQWEMPAKVATSLAAGTEILVGFAGPLTGQMGLGGEQMQYGFELTLAELNAAGGLLGRKVAFKLVDDYCDPEQAVAAARKLVADRVVAVIGHLCSGAAIPASEVYEAARIPFLTMATNPRLTERRLRLTFRVNARDEQQAEHAAEHLVRQLGAKRIAVVHDSSVYGKGSAELVQAELNDLGIPAVLFEAVQPGQLLFGDVIGRLRRAEIEVLYYGGYPPAAGLLRRQMAEAGFLPSMMTTAGASNEEYSLIAGPAAEGTLVVVDRPFDTAEHAAFQAGFRAAYHYEPNTRAGRGYASLEIWAQAVAAAGTTEGAAVARALRSETFHVFGVEARFDDKGDVQGPLGGSGLWVWRGNSLVPLEE